MISDKLIDKTFKYFDEFKDNEFIVMPSLPILYFGDLDSYAKSKIKIITVGKNPSDNEFRLDKQDVFSFIRFSKWNQDTRNLIPTLNPYFESKPLSQWFSSFEPILNGLSASYYQESNQKNIAIHTDICSPLATNPTWSKLTKEIRKSLHREGEVIWKELVEELQPDIMLVSIPRKLFEKIFKNKQKNLITFEYKADGKERRKPYAVEEYEYELQSNKKVKVIFGTAAQMPFGTISNNQKEQIGELFLKTLCD